MTNALELIGRLGPGAAVGEVADLVQPVTADLNEPGAADDPVVFNAASDVIDDVYAFTRYWANYVSLELGPWLINWVPFGYLISDQIVMWYSNFVLPVVDSFVYDFLDPVVNEPLNPAVWLQGIGDIINTAATGVYNGIVSEIQYIVSLRWLPFPLPPLPNLPLPGAAASADEVAMAAADVDTADVDVAETADEVSTEAESTGETVEGSEIHSEKPGLDFEAPAEDVDDPAGNEADEALDEISDESEEPGDGVEQDLGEDSGEADADGADVTKPTSVDTPDSTDSEGGENGSDA